MEQAIFRGDITSRRYIDQNFHAETSVMGMKDSLRRSCYVFSRVLNLGRFFLKVTLVDRYVGYPTNEGK